MFSAKARKVIRYTKSDGSEPFDQWLSQIQDTKVQGIIFQRIRRLGYGLFGDCKSVGDGVHELRINFGPGYRIYFGSDRLGNLILLLIGGDKKTQSRDILLAKLYWQDYKEQK